jgi:hypothetical protein
MSSHEVFLMSYDLSLIFDSSTDLNHSVRVESRKQPLPPQKVYGGPAGHIWFGLQFIKCSWSPAMGSGTGYAILLVSDLCCMLRINDVRVSVGVIAWSREIVPCR